MSDNKIVDLQSKRPADWLDRLLEGIREEQPLSAIVVWVGKDDPNCTQFRVSLGPDDHGLGLLWALDECKDDLREMLRSPDG